MAPEPKGYLLGFKQLIAKQNVGFAWSNFGHVETAEMLEVSMPRLKRLASRIQAPQKFLESTYSIIQQLGAHLFLAAYCLSAVVVVSIQDPTFVD